MLKGGEKRCIVLVIYVELDNVFPSCLSRVNRVPDYMILRVFAQGVEQISSPVDASAITEAARLQGFGNVCRHMTHIVG